MLRRSRCLFVWGAVDTDAAGDVFEAVSEMEWNGMEWISNSIEASASGFENGRIEDIPPMNAIPHRLFLGTGVGHSFLVRDINYQGGAYLTLHMLHIIIIKCNIHIQGYINVGKIRNYTCYPCFT